MRSKVTPTIVLLLILFIVFFLIYIKFYDEEKASFKSEMQTYETACGKYKKDDVKIGSKILSADISDNDCKEELGLSGKTSIGEDEGMIFMFQKLSNYGFWMKNMNFPLDILWVDDNFKIVGIEKNILPSTYPKTFGEKYFAKYVLEISAGYCDKNNIKIGDKIILSER